jgi:hypothetical protein
MNYSGFWLKGWVVTYDDSENRNPGLQVPERVGARYSWEDDLVCAPELGRGFGAERVEVVVETCVGR